MILKGDLGMAPDIKGMFFVKRGLVFTLLVDEKC